MTVLAKTIIKRLSDCVVGELVGFEVNDRHCLAIALDAAGPGARYIALLNPDGVENTSPVMGTEKWNTYVVSYGADWAIRPVVGDESYPRNRRHIERPGSLHQCGHRWILCFRKAGGYSTDTLYLDVVTKARDSYPDAEAVPYLRWELWDHVPETQFLPAPFFTMDVRADKG